mgnify:CR=1 FL=1
MNKETLSRPTAMYIHGLASGANSNTGKVMQKLFPNYNWLLPEVGEVLIEAIDTINQWIEKHNPQVIIGTSYGGLMTMYANATDSVKIVCNPAVNAEVSFVEKIGLGEQNICYRRSHLPRNSRLQSEPQPYSRCAKPCYICRKR